jgi:acyl-CoA synthetase (AMP-forming)/AMP-acid ligase II
MNASVLFDVLREHAACRGSALAYRYLEDGEHETRTQTFADLLLRATRIGAYLSEQRLRSRTVVLLIRDELTFLEGLLGCFCAGAIAVPVMMPRRDSEMTALHAVTRNAEAQAVLLSRLDQRFHEPLLKTISHLRQLYCEDASACADGPAVEVQPSDLAFLQYTSGSTGAPKGVCITHANLMANERAIQKAMQLNEATLFVSWLPLFHDMGLIGGALQPLFLGVTCVLMPPQAFLMKPFRWLQALSRYRGTVSGAPNFAYDLCVDKVSDAQRASLDLSSWAVAFNGSEPVRAATLERFATTFGRAGFRRSAFYPCYGMAESTLIVSGPVPGTDPHVKRFQAKSLQPGAHPLPAPDGDETAADVVACGQAVLDTEICIVDPHHHCALPAGHVGEIWIRGPSITSGYYGALEQTARSFGRLKTQSGTFLRTGDLGCLHGGQLLVLGRLKDIIIIRGRKYYPQDLETTAAASSPLLIPGGGAALTIPGVRDDSLIIVHEVTRQAWRTVDADQLSADIRHALVQQHGIAPSSVILIKPGALPRTSSGKVRRARCRDLFLNAAFESLRERSSAQAEHRPSMSSGLTPMQEGGA